MMVGIIFAFWRFLQIVTLIPTMGMLASFVNLYASNNALTPTYVLCLFIVSVLALAWAIATLFTYHRSSANSRFVAIIDLFFLGAFIAAVYALRGIAKQNCTSVTTKSSYQISLGVVGKATLNRLNFKANRQCSMLKASFAFGIMNCIFFAITSVLAALIGETSSDGDNYPRETHSRRHSRHRSQHRRSSRRSEYV
ncbi:unnamed protein product [Blumeria hordei]|uniref:MARVEL domain-containing protein n=2 Tax=Blumeria hordei TaxID=2867405 RepID=A0A383UJB4_BLUHO|nr:hypothetical protein BGHDH14_bgh04009 [Blumeria hordei DH14]SZE99327.1 unnamed protein product [Blumeria hordei]